MFRLTNPSLIFNEYGRATAKPTDARPGTPTRPCGRDGHPLRVGTAADRGGLATDGPRAYPVFRIRRPGSSAPKQRGRIKGKSAKIPSRAPVFLQSGRNSFRISRGRNALAPPGGGIRRSSFRQWPSTPQSRSQQRPVHTAQRFRRRCCPGFDA